ncbi:hypothetical protein E5676_scaffold3068G00010 [Cucumis melo var. makuwa]|uniref:Uncharacterized protein n=1 Tax=Cucumis melo var. makuwa TaxID=1194695 RepID=A0A5A7VE27_CUCMM|nr:hypothetical protein E6C27_scaffold548G00790 [Cucumis melo var. makuwa]TYK16006.1 hypothetical protein E5676_scaffold3068G00010 [Cucumis melo var. makuwa]
MESMAKPKENEMKGKEVLQINMNVNEAELDIFKDCIVRWDRQSDIDKDYRPIQVIRWDRSQPDCLSISSGYTTYQFVLGVPLGSPKTNYVPRGSHVARVRERANSWVPLFRTLIGS